MGIPEIIWIALESGALAIRLKAVAEGKLKSIIPSVLAVSIQVWLLVWGGFFR